MPTPFFVLTAVPPFEIENTHKINGIVVKHSCRLIDDNLALVNFTFINLYGELKRNCILIKIIHPFNHHLYVIEQFNIGTLTQILLSIPQPARVNQAFG